MTDPTGPELEAIGVARHREGEYASAMAAFERAHAAYRRDGDLLGAARSARTVGWFRGWIFGDWAVHGGWMTRARRLLEGAAAADGRLEGWRLLDIARVGADLAAQRQQYETVIALARHHCDRDLECEATVSLGVMLVFSGLADEGMGHLDEALAALCAGDVDELPVLEGCLCGLFSACERTHDVERAEQWLRAADDLITRRNLVAVASYCRAHYAGILIAAGRWAEAEDELLRAISAPLEGLAVQIGAQCRLADLRIRQGRLEDAAALLHDIGDREDAVQPMVALHLARGEPQIAVERLDRALISPTLEPHVEAPLLALAADAHLALGDVDAAARASGRLSSLAVDGSSPYLDAIAARARARLSDDHRDVRTNLHTTIVRFAEAKLPWDAARARLELARALAVDRPQAAAHEAALALVAFEGLGARRDADAAAALLRSLGAPTRPGPRAHERLTRREQEVLELVALGLSNAEIAGRLYISPKTAEHHVGRILAKLGLRRRAEAAAVVARGE